MVYPGSFHDDDDNVRPDCLKLMSLRWDPEQYAKQARRIRKKVQQREYEVHQRERLRQERRKTQQEAKRFFEVVDADDDADEEEPAPDLMELLKRADYRDDPDTSSTA